jgi:hypothetical protein
MNFKSISGIPLEITHADPNPNNDKNFCPINNIKGMRILQKTLANHIQPKYWESITDDFYFCEEENCKIVYFNREKQVFFTQKETRTLVMHKMPIVIHDDRPACYCKNVLERKIIEEITLKKCCDSLIDIQKFTEANTGKDCVITNPSGRCCGKQLTKMINWLKKQEDSINIEEDLLGQAIECCNRIDDSTSVNN